MAFSEFRFFVFFLVVFSIYWLLRRNLYRKSWLLACSYAFYAAWDWRFLSLILFSTAVDYCIGILLTQTDNQSKRRWLLAVSLVANLGLLAFFKYCGFFVESSQELFSLLGLPFKTETLNIILPVGISFYTFQTLSYTIDVYRRQLNPTRNLVDFALFVCFFPQLVAGPIVRARCFLPQLDRIRTWSWTRTHFGMRLIVIGLFKKLAIADRMASYVDPVFADVGLYETGTLWFAAIGFMIQVYCDFSGYSDMAIGTANLLGFRLTKNFDMPFASSNISDFWRRWHISLSSWVRDYVYFPLGGSRRGNWNTVRNLVVAMTLVGFWHGAAWRFILFGFLQGVLISLYIQLRRFYSSRPRLEAWLAGRFGAALGNALTLFCFCTTLVIFRANSVPEGFQMLGRMFVPSSGNGIPLNERGFWLALTILIVAHIVGHHHRFFERVAEYVPAPVRGFGYAAAFTAAMVLAPDIDQAFIYFQF